MFVLHLFDVQSMLRNIYERHELVRQEVKEVY